MKSLIFSKKTSVFIVSILLLVQVISPMSASATGWDTPSGSNPTGFKISDLVNPNPQILVSAIGCTGIVTLASKASITFLTKLAIRVGILTAKSSVSGGAAAANIVANTAATAAAVAAATPGFPTADVGLRAILIATNAMLTANSTAANAIAIANDTSADARKEIQQQQAESDSFREECLNGIAVALAKNQLEKMTRATLNWVGSGFNGDPLFVRNANSFMNNITNDILKKETDYFARPENAASYPYGKDFARGAINSSRSATNFDAATKQNLTDYLTPGSTPQSFAGDFSQGGGGGWLALTQNPQNNPLGFTQLESQNIADKQANAKNNTQQ
ncbi:MAG: hypothetical protein WCK91_02655, partial [bacterium]